LPWCIWLFCSWTLQQLWCWIFLSNVMKHFTLLHKFADVSQDPVAFIVVAMLEAAVSFDQSIFSVTLMKLLIPCSICSVKTRIIPLLRLYGTCDRRCYRKFWSISLTLKHLQYTKFSGIFYKMSVLDHEPSLKMWSTSVRNVQLTILRN
jgi:hypothetical protein